ncbi:hypothetical protein ACU4GD_29325 [Cupriavidus basilensis]
MSITSLMTSGARAGTQPTPRGLEGKIGDKLRHLRDLDAQWQRQQGKGKGRDEGGEGGRNSAHRQRAGRAASRTSGRSACLVPRPVVRRLPRPVQ